MRKGRKNETFKLVPIVIIIGILLILIVLYAPIPAWLKKSSYCTKRLNVDSVTDRYRESNFYCADAILRECENI